MFVYPPIMLITDRVQATLPLVEIITQSLDAGCKWILFRDVELNDDAFLAAAAPIQQLCKQHDALFFMSHRYHLAKMLHADGVHLSSKQNLIDIKNRCAELRLGQSCHNENELRLAAQNGADYVSLSPIFKTLSKPAYGPALGTSLLASYAKEITCPLLALGGITAENARSCLSAGAAGVAIMGTIMRSKSPKLAFKHFISSIQ